MKCEPVIVQIAEEILWAKSEIHHHGDETLKAVSESYGQCAAVKRELFCDETIHERAWIRVVSCQNQRLGQLRSPGIVVLNQQ
jgi:hypothetical protein